MGWLIYVWLSLALCVYFSDKITWMALNLSYLSDYACVIDVCDASYSLGSFLFLSFVVHRSLFRFRIIECNNFSCCFRVSSSQPLWSPLQRLKSNCFASLPSTRRLSMHWSCFGASFPRQQSQICQSLALSSQIWFLWETVWKREKCSLNCCTPHVSVYEHSRDSIYVIILHLANTCWTYFTHTHRLEQSEHGVKNVEFRESTLTRHSRTMFVSRSSSREENSRSEKKFKKSFNES